MTLSLLFGCQGTPDSKIQEDSTYIESSEPSQENEDLSCTAWNDLGELDYQNLSIEIEGHIQSCSEVQIPSAASKAYLLALTYLFEHDPALEIRIKNLQDTDLFSSVPNESIDQPFYLDETGEFFISVRNTDASKSLPYSFVIDCIDNCTASYTRYPIVFMHGLAGFDTLLNVFDYWNGVETALSNAGYRTLIRGVSAFDPTPVRADMWKEHLDAFFLEFGHRRVNIIAHSQGGLDARYFTSILDTEARVASITTMATPHHGSSVAGLLSNIVELGPTEGQIVDALVSAASELFGTTGSSFSEQLSMMSPENMTTFNQNVPNIEGVSYFSWAGRSCRYLQWTCQSNNEGETVSSYFLLSHAYLETQEGENDGLVSVESAKWGQFMGIVPADHIDEVGHRFDLSTQPFNAVEFYLNEAKRLSELGF